MTTSTPTLPALETAHDRREGDRQEGDRRRRPLVWGLAVVALVTAIVGAAMLSSSGGSGHPARSDRSSLVEAGDGEYLEDFEGEASSGGGVTIAGGGPSTGGGSGEIDGGGILEPMPEPQPEPEPEPEPQPEPEPEVEPPPAPAQLSATPDPVNLKPNVYSGSFKIKNLGGQPLHWELSSKPSVTLSSTSGDLDGLSSTTINFTIDKNTLTDGAFTFKIKVATNAGNQYVDVNGFKPFGQIQNLQP